MTSELDRAFEAWPSFRWPAFHAQPVLEAAAWIPGIDVFEKENRLITKVDLPGLKKEDVKVELLDGTLTIEGERQQEKEEKGKTFHKIEREYGKFLRRFAMPSEVDASKVQADFKNGVLNVHLPKSAMAKPKSIDVKVS